MKRYFLLVPMMLGACSDGDNGSNQEELITTVTLAFTPTGGGAPITASFRDPDGDGGEPPTVDPVNLPASTYVLTVRFLNELETPAEDITLEVADEADEHQVFFTGTAPLVHSYEDMDLRGLPIGLTNRMVASAGTGTLTVTLRHLPPVNDTPVKTATLADTAKTMGIAALPGESDANVNFMVTVQ